MLKTNLAAIEVSGDEVRVAIVRAGGRRPEVLELASASAVYTDPAEREEALGRALDQALEKTTTRVVGYVYCASSAKTIVRNLTIPFRGARRVATAVKFELEPYLALPIENLTLDFVQIGEFEGQTEVLAVAMRNDQVALDRVPLQAAGVEVDAITVDAAALTSLWASSRTLKGLQAVLHLRERDACIAITHNKKLAFFRNLPYSAQQVEASPEALARDAANTLRAFAAKWAGGGEVERLCVTGISLGHAEAAALSETIGIPVDHEIMLSGVTVQMAAKAALHEHAEFNHWEALVGAAHAAATGSFHLDLTREHAQTGATVRAVAGHVIFSCALAFLLICGWGFYFYERAQQNELLAQQLADQTAALNEEILALQEGSLPEGIDPAVFTDPPLIDVLRELGNKLPSDKVDVSEIRIAAPNARSAWLTVEGKVGNSGQLVEIYEELKKSPLFSFDGEPDVRVEEGVTTFSIKANRPVAATPGEAAAAAEAVPAADGAVEPAPLPEATPAAEAAPAEAAPAAAEPAPAPAEPAPAEPAPAAETPAPAEAPQS